MRKISILVFTASLAVWKVWGQAKKMYTLRVERVLLAAENVCCPGLTPKVMTTEGIEGNDPLKTNAVQIFKTKNIIFRTV